MMTLERFKALCQAYGGDLRRWPDVERADAQALAAQSERARYALADAAMLDAALSQARSPAPSPDLARRIAAGAPGTPAPRSATPGWAAMAAALALAVGLGAGWLGAGGGAPEDDVFAEAFGSLDAPVSPLWEDA
ncbi:MAG: hypothetical protein ACFE0P_05775 [Oceanicaulis sp.]